MMYVRQQVDEGGGEPHPWAGNANRVIYWTKPEGWITLQIKKVFLALKQGHQTMGGISGAHGRFIFSRQLGLIDVTMITRCLIAVCVVSVWVKHG